MKTQREVEREVERKVVEAQLLRGPLTVSQLSQLTNVSVKRCYSHLHAFAMDGRITRTSAKRPEWKSNGPRYVYQLAPKS